MDFRHLASIFYFIRKWIHPRGCRKNPKSIIIKYPYHTLTHKEKPLFRKIKWPGTWLAELHIIDPWTRLSMGKQLTQIHGLMFLLMIAHPKVHETMSSECQEHMNFINLMVSNFFLVLKDSWGSLMGHTSRLTELPCWLHTLIPPQQHLPLPRRGVTSDTFQCEQFLTLSNLSYSWHYSILAVSDTFKSKQFWRLSNYNIFQTWWILTFPILSNSDNFPILTLSNFDTTVFWHFPILTLSNSDTLQFWHFPILNLSNSDTFRFWLFYSLSLWSV